MSVAASPKHSTARHRQSTVLHAAYSPPKQPTLRGMGGGAQVVPVLSAPCGGIRKQLRAPAPGRAQARDCAPTNAGGALFSLASARPGARGRAQARVCAPATLRWDATNREHSRLFCAPTERRWVAAARAPRRAQARVCALRNARREAANRAPKRAFAHSPSARLRTHRARVCAPTKVRWGAAKQR